MSIVKHTESFEIAQPVDKLFPLFSAEGEKLWVPGWDYENIMESTDLHEDYVFVTTDHDHASEKAVWIVKSYKPDSHLIELYKVEAKNKVGVIKIQCESKGEMLTEVEVTYSYIGLSDEGNQFVSQFTNSKYSEFIEEWKELLDKHFAADV